MLSEKQLIKNCLQGNKSSQYELVKRYSKMLMAVCRRYARDEAAAKDVLQESLIRIFTHLEKYTPNEQGTFEGWLRTIAIRCSLTWINKSCFKQEIAPLEFPDHQSTEPEVYSYFGLEAINLLLKELPDGFRTIFNLNIVEGYSHKEIANLLDITESTSRSQLARARKMLQEKIKFHKKKMNPHEVGKF